MEFRRIAGLVVVLLLLAGAFWAFTLVHADDLLEEPAGADDRDAGAALREKEKRATSGSARGAPVVSSSHPEGAAAILEEHFEIWPPTDWAIINNGGDCVWKSTAATGRPNYAGGDGRAAVADSDWCGTDSTMDTELRTPSMDLASYGGGTLEFVAAYNWWSGTEYLEVDVSSDGGSSWINLLRWTEDHDAYGPGQWVRIDLSPYASNRVVVRFHYVAPGWQFYAIVDQVRVLPPMPELSTSYKSATGLAMPGDVVTYTVVVRNAGNVSALDTSIVDPIPLSTTLAYTIGPPGLIYHSIQDRLEWTGTVTQGESVEVSFAVTVREEVGCRSVITNSAIVSQSQIPRPVILQHDMQIWDQVYYATDLEADGGMLVSSGSHSSWAWGEPDSGPRQAHSGAKVWATNLQGTYSNSEDSYLTSPPIDLSTAANAPGYELWLRWWDWFWSERCCDYGVLEARGGEVDWIPVSSQFRDNLGGWTEHDVDISSFAGASDFQFRFRLHSDATLAFDGWYVDDIAIYQCAPPPGLYLWADGVEAEGCVGVGQTHSFNLFNATGADGAFDLTYDLVNPAYGSLEGPSVLSLASQAGTRFDTTFTPELCLPDGLELLASLEASGNGYSDVSYITKTVTTEGECPVCPEAGWLEGHVYDHNGANPPCSDATVHIDPEDIDVTVDGTGYFTVSLIPFDYEVTAWAIGYPLPAGPQAATVQDNQINRIALTLVRPDADVAPQTVVAEAAIFDTATRVFGITNRGTYTLAYQIREGATDRAELGPPTTVGGPPPSPETKPAQIEIEPALAAELSADETTGYLIDFRERPDLGPAFDMDWLSRGRFVVEALKATADRSQARVRAYLDAHGADYQAFWIDNLIVVKSSSYDTFDGLGAFAEIEALRAQRHPILYEPVDQHPSGPNLVGAEPNISHVGAERVWDELGVRGEGIVVANIDTGVRYTHEALVRQYRGNLGDGAFDHNHNWWDPEIGGSDLVPNDWHNHGSHTMGTMLGDNGVDAQIGMAPEATWIACQGFEEDDAELLECGQFMAAPWDLSGANPDPDRRPHVINNSWGDCLRYADHWFDGVIDSWHALGIYPVFSVGNATNCGYLMPPGCNTVGNPGRAGNVTSVGSTGQDNGGYAPHSNWGPTDDPDTVNAIGYPNLKPQVLAPGVSIRSAYKSSDTAYGLMGGTSMSAPHVAGLVALMWSAAPCLAGDYATTEAIMEQTATPIPYSSDCGGEGPGNLPNFATGWGEINAFDAVQAAIGFCRSDWLPWVETDVVSGALGSTGEQLVQVTFTCTPTAAQQTQPLEGHLRLFHNDPCQEPLDVQLAFYCYAENPIPTWKKTVWINDREVDPVLGPHVVGAGDMVRVVDWIGAFFSEPVTLALAGTWEDALRLLESDWYPGPFTPMDDRDGFTAFWVLTDVAPNIRHPITRTFEVQDGDWRTTMIVDRFTVRDALEQLPDMAVILKKRRLRVYLPVLARNP